MQRVEFCQGAKYTRLNNSPNVLSPQAVTIDMLHYGAQASLVNLGEIGKRVRGLRAELGLTQQQLADKAKIAIGTLQALEAAPRQKRPRQTSNENIERIAKALGKTFDDLTADRNQIAADNPLLDKLTDEDLLIARAYHDARTSMRQRVESLLLRGEPVRLTRLAELLRSREDLWPLLETMIQKDIKPSSIKIGNH